MTAFPQAGDRAPAVALPGIPEGRGHVLLVFYKDSCPTCQYTMPFVERVHRELAPRGGRVVAIAQDDAGRTRAFAEKFGLTMPILVDAPAYEVSIAYGVATVPSIFVIEPAAAGGGVVRRAFAGFGRKLLVEAAADLAASLGVPPPEIFRPDENVLDSKPG